MNRNFTGTAGELDSDLLMVWHALSQWERMDGEWGQQVRHLKSDLRKRQEERRHRDSQEMAKEEPKRTWVRTSQSWHLTGSPFHIGFYPKQPSAWTVFHSESPEGEGGCDIATFNLMEEARTFAEKRWNDMQLFRDGP